MRAPVVSPRREPTATTAVSDPPVPALLPARIRLALSHAEPSEHSAIHQFLVSATRRPSLTEFHSQNEDPFHEPHHRLLVKHDDRIVAHVRWTNREMVFGSATLPIARLHDLVTLPEYRGHGCAAALVEAAEKRVAADGALLAVVKTQHPRLFLSRGWAVCGRHSFSLANARDILAQGWAMQATGRCEATDGYRPELTIRLWRQVELDALMRLYRQATAGTFGSLVRSENYWRWLIGRRAHDRMYVAVEGPDTMELNDPRTSMVGYAAIRDGRIAELVASPNRPDAADKLLARACGDAIERDIVLMRLEGPPSLAQHRLVAAASGEYRSFEFESGEAFLVKLFQPLELLERLCPLLHERAVSAGLSLPCELGLTVPGEKVRMAISRRMAKLITEKLGRNFLECPGPSLTQLLLGHLDVERAVRSGHCVASSRTAVALSRCLFPELPLCWPAFDDLTV